MPLYPNPPAERIAYDRDGTVALDINSGAAVLISAAHIAGTNVEAGTRTFNEDRSGAASTGTPNFWWVMIFPQLMDITHFFHLATWTAGTGTSTARPLESSTNTTNGIDGTWSTIAAGASGAQHAYGATSILNRRSVMAGGIHALTANNTGIKAIRFGAIHGAGEGYRYGSVHLYGKPSTPANTLVLWHPTLDQPITDFPAHLDFEDKPQSTTTDKTFRVKNVSSLTASSITVSMQALQDSSPTFVSQYTFNYNGGAYASTASLSSLAPNTISQVFTVRQSLLSNASLNIWAHRIVASATGWS